MRNKFLQFQVYFQTKIFFFILFTEHNRILLLLLLLLLYNYIYSNFLLFLFFNKPNGEKKVSQK
jgi:hypothetical protein